MVYKILDLFAGAGGFSLGFENIRDKKNAPTFEMFKAVEIDKYACDTLRTNFGYDKVIEGDITNKKIHDMIINECNGKIDLIIGGIPCQSFSLIGTRTGKKKKNEDKRDILYMEYFEIVKKLKPKIIVIENVKGILSKKDKHGNLIFENIIKDFERTGYSFETEEDKKYMLLNAADFGVPQKRERIFVVGLRNDLFPNIKVPVPKKTHGKNKNLFPYVTLLDSIGDLPKVYPKVTGTGLTTLMRSRLMKKNRRIYNGEEAKPYDRTDLIKHISDNVIRKNFFQFVRPNGCALYYHIARSQQLSDIMLYKGMKQGWTAKDVMEKGGMLKQYIKYDMRSFKDKYRKQKWLEPSTTIFAHLEKDGNRFIHPTQARTFTPREAARIQSFPDDFLFEGPLSKKFKQIGNAVPPLLAFHTGLVIKTIFEETK